MAPASIKQVKDFFEEKSVTQFRKEWLELTPEDRTQLSEGIGNGTLTY